MADAMEDLEETQYDRYISDQKELLDDLFDEYESALNERLDDIDALIGEMIDMANANAADICTTIIDRSDEVGYTPENAKAIWSNEGAAGSIISKYGDQFTTYSTSVNDVLSKIRVAVEKMAGISEDMATDKIKSSDATTPTLAPQSPAPSNTSKSSEPPKSAEKKITVGGMINAGSAKIYQSSGGKGLNQYFSSDPVYTVLEDKNGWLRVRHHKISSGTTGWFKKSDVKAYKRGGLADYTGAAWLDGTPSNPEMVLDARDTENFIALKDAMRSIASGGDLLSNILGGEGASKIVQQLAKINSPLLSGDLGSNNFTYHVNIPIEHVQDYNDFVNKLREDGRFEDMIQSMTVKRLSGGSKLDKHKYKW